MKRWLYVIFILLITILYASEMPSVAQIISIEGIVLYHKNDSFYWEEAKVGAQFSNYDELKTTSASYCEVLFNEGHIFRMDPNSHLVFEAVSMGDQEDLWQNLRVSFGRIWIKLVHGTSKSEQFIVETPYVSIPKQDALFAVTAPAGKISAFEGDLQVRNKSSETMVIKGGYEAVVNESGKLQSPKPLSMQTLSEFDEFKQSSSLPKEQLDRADAEIKEVQRQIVRARVGSSPASVDAKRMSKKERWFDRLLDWFGR